MTAELDRYTWYADFLRRAGLEPKGFEDWRAGTVDRYTMTAAEIGDAVKSWRPPTKGQIEAGNYQKPTIAWKGLTIKIETPKGERRRPEWPPMPAHYGYFVRVGQDAVDPARDGDKPDVFIGPQPASDLVVVIDQETPAGRFDEWKVVIGCQNQQDAIEIYRRAYTPGWRVGPATSLTVEQFKAWLADMPAKGRIAEQVSRYTAVGEPDRYNAEEAIVKGFRERLKGLPEDGILDVWYDIDAEQAIINAGDWVEKGVLDQWKRTCGDFVKKVSVEDEAGGPDSKEWIKVYRQPGTPDRYAFTFSPPRPRDAHGHFLHVWRPDTEPQSFKPPAPLPITPSGPPAARVVGNPPQPRGWIGVDLDGTLARYDDAQGHWRIGEPVPEMVARVKRWLAEGRDVRILTARVYGPEAEQQRRLIEEWCRQYIGRVLPVTNQKDPQMYEFWDDRAVQVARNSGTPVGRFTQDGDPEPSPPVEAEPDADFEHDVQATAAKYALSAQETRDLMDRYCGLVAQELPNSPPEAEASPRTGHDDTH